MVLLGFSSSPELSGTVRAHFCFQGSAPGLAKIIATLCMTLLPKSPLKVDLIASVCLSHTAVWWPGGKGGPLLRQFPWMSHNLTTLGPASSPFAQHCKGTSPAHHSVVPGWPVRRWAGCTLPINLSIESRGWVKLPAARY